MPTVAGHQHRTAPDRPATPRDDVAHARPPQQERSRQSFERALDAAVALLDERGSDSFTLAEVARRADVSIGSIYGRVKSKDDLLRSAQSRELLRIEQESSQAFQHPDLDVIDLPTAAGFAVGVAADVLRRNAGVLGPFMLLANSDPVIASAGANSHKSLVGSYTDVLMCAADSITRADPEEAVQWTFTVVYSVLARYLGLGSSRESAGQGDWHLMLANLVDMTVSFLTSGPSEGSHHR